MYIAFDTWYIYAGRFRVLKYLNVIKKLKRKHGIRKFVVFDFQIRGISAALNNPDRLIRIHEDAINYSKYIWGEKSRFKISDLPSFTGGDEEKAAKLEYFFVKAKDRDAAPPGSERGKLKLSREIVSKIERLQTVLDPHDFAWYSAQAIAKTVNLTIIRESSEPDENVVRSFLSEIKDKVCVSYCPKNVLQHIEDVRLAYAMMNFASKNAFLVVVCLPSNVSRNECFRHIMQYLSKTKKGILLAIDPSTYSLK